MPECDTRIGRNVADSAALIDQFVNNTIARARAAAPGNDARVVELVYADLGDASLLNGNQSGIETWAHALSSTYYSPLRKEWTKYKNVRHDMWIASTAGSDFNGYTRVLSGTMLVNGVYIGADKLGHFMQQGYRYFRIVEDGGQIADAIAWGHTTERGVYGLLTTGVFSNADKEANLAGYRFWTWLSRGPTTAFRIADYVNLNWNEEHNTNAYHRNTVGAVVWLNLMNGDWHGQITRSAFPTEPAIGIRLRLAIVGSGIAGSDLTGEFHYDDPAIGPRAAAINCRIAQLDWVPDGSLGIRGVRVDFAWRTRHHTGRGIWRTRTREDYLDGTWGMANSHDDGGRFTIWKA